MMMSASQLPDKTLPWPLPLSDVFDLAHHEQGPHGGPALVSYKCPAGRWTNGWGETDGVGPGLRWTKAYADRRFCDSLTERCNAVRDMCVIQPTQNQLAALTRISYNIGLGYDPGKPKPAGAGPGLWNSSIIRAHNKGNFQSAARAFNLYIHATNPATGKFYDPPLAGLVSRRAQESARYLEPDEDDAPHQMPQAVEPEAPLAKSPTMNASVLVGSAGVLSTLTEVGTQADTAGSALGSIGNGLKSVKDLAFDVIGIDPKYWLPMLCIAAAVIIVYRRHKQRKEGLA